MRVTSIESNRVAVVRFLFLCAVLTGICVAAQVRAQMSPDPDILGVYFDTEATSNTVDLVLPGYVTAYLVLTNPSQEGPLVGWECRVGFDPEPFVVDYLSLVAGVNLAGGPDYLVGIGRRDPLPSDDVVVLASLTIFMTVDQTYDIYLHPCSRPTVPGEMIYVAGDDPGAFTTLNWLSGDEALPVAVINPGPPAGTVDIDPEPDSISAGWTVTGPDSYETSGNGDAVLADLPVGTYELTWDDVVLWNTPTPNPVSFDVTEGETTTVQGVYDQNPKILEISDVGNDQGRRVRMIWRRTGHDEPSDPIVVTDYGVYRRQDEYKSVPGDKLAGWDFLEAVPAHGEEIYQYVAETLCDSTIADGFCWTAFFIRGMTDDPYVFYDSAVDSGYSVDNLAPGSVKDLNVAYAAVGNDLNWSAGEEEDLNVYRIYRSSTDECDFELDQPVATVAGTSWSDDLAGFDGDAWDVCYRITAVDFSGNESDPTLWAETGLSGVMVPGMPRDFALHENFPNPFNPRTTIRFDLPRPEPVDITIFDVQGRRVRSLETGVEREAGHHSAVWTGRDDAGRPLPAGVYVYRVATPTYAATGRMVLIK